MTQKEKMVDLMDNLLVVTKVICDRAIEGKATQAEIASLPNLVNSINDLTKYACLG